jgi:hypothetical protein
VTYEADRRVLPRTGKGLGTGKIDETPRFIDERDSTAGCEAVIVWRMMQDAPFAVTPAPATLEPQSGPFDPEVVKLGLGFAAVLFFVSSLIWGLVGVDPVASAVGKLIGIAADTMLAIVITLILWMLREYRLGVKALAACTLSLVLSPVSALVDRGLQLYFLYPVVPPIDPIYVGHVVIFTVSELFGWSCLYLALQYNRQTRLAEQRLTLMREEALAAQMRALQYQLNPHFLFNTLNSVAGLIEERANFQAAEMTLRLAAFLRRTLALDPDRDVTLREELALQQDYLAIEQIRFSDRMTVKIVVDPAMHDVLLPPLILQPLFENAIKHGLAQVKGQTELVFWASESPAGVLCLWLENTTTENPDKSHRGFGIGLDNISRRLAMRWPGRAKCIGTLIAPNRYRAEICLPVTR